MKQAGQHRRRIVGGMDRTRPDVSPVAGNGRKWPSQPEGSPADKTSVSNRESLDSRAPNVHDQSQVSGRVQEFWKELIHAVGPNFSGNLVLHCAHGTVMKYEVHQVLRPRGGPVVVEGLLDASTSDIVECME